jgi:hypothetical protein
MLNVFDIPKPQNGFISVFPGFSGSSGDWVPWEKPSNIIMVSITCIGGGGGGGSGFPSATATARGGGGGGASGGFSTLKIPANLLPDTLYVSAGLGGNGGASSTTVSNLGTSGFRSVVSIAQSSAAIYNVCIASPGSNGFAAPSATIAGTGGVAPPAATVAGTLLAGLGIFTAFAGQNGAAGGAVANGPGGSITYPTTGLLLSGGAGGGGGSTGVGGNITAPASQTAVLNLFATLVGGAAGATAGNGSSGVQRLTPLLNTGGSGGGCNSGNARGGNGGQGGFGSGGGGGGAGGTTGGSGAGGNGGPGLVIIQSW